MPVLVVKPKPFSSLAPFDLELKHDPVEGDFRQALAEIRLQFAGVKILAGHVPILANLASSAHPLRPVDYSS
jgi:hypothetical protein